MVAENLSKTGGYRLWPIWLVLAIALFLGALFFSYWKRGKSGATKYDHVIRSAGKHYQVNPALVKAVVWRESRFDHEVRGLAGEIGLMQIRELAAQEWADAEGVSPFDHEHIVDPKTNALVGSWYLRKLLDRYKGTDNALPYALADYNAGRTRVLGWLGGAAKTNSHAFYRQIGFPGTKKYVHSVMNRFLHYKKNKDSVL
jgi:soluble lytic murein transglycosylase